MLGYRATNNFLLSVLSAMVLLLATSPSQTSPTSLNFWERKFHLLFSKPRQRSPPSGSPAVVIRSPPQGLPADVIWSPLKGVNLSPPKVQLSDVNLHLFFGLILNFPTKCVANYNHSQTHHHSILVSGTTCTYQLIICLNSNSNHQLEHKAGVAVEHTFHEHKHDWHSIMLDGTNTCVTDNLYCQLDINAQVLSIYCVSNDRSKVLLLSAFAFMHMLSILLTLMSVIQSSYCLILLTFNHLSCELYLNQNGSAFTFITVWITIMGRRPKRPSLLEVSRTIYGKCKI